MEKKIVVGIPCYNEALTIGKVVSDFKREIPDARILVADNNSKDNTAKKALEAGAEVFLEKKQGRDIMLQYVIKKFSHNFI